MTPRISVVIPSFANYDGLAKVLDGLAEQTEPAGEFEALVVVDRNDPDPLAAERAIGTRPFPVRQLRGERPGASANRNAGWRAASAPVILFIDNDTVPEPDLVREHLAWHGRLPDPMLAILGHVRWARSVRVTPFMRWLDQGIQFDYPSIRGIDAGWGRFYSANISVKRTMLERVDGFDEERFPYGYEDLDLALRAQPYGLRVFYNREAAVEHLREYDLDFFKRRVRRIAKSERQFVRKHPDQEPFFFRMFSHAAGLERAGGRGRHLIRWVPRGTPLIGEPVWLSADLFYRQELAPDFLAAWEASGAGSAPGEPVAPLTDELGTSGPSSAAGPK